MTILLQILRQNPATNSAPLFVDYEIEVEPNDRILDALLYVKERIDGSLGLRKSCGHGVCGSDAMIINGKERLACKTLVQDVAESEGAVVIVEPLRHLPVQKDLMVDQEAFFGKYRAVKPFFIGDESGEPKERIQSPEDRARFDDPTNCILCAACYSACPVLDDNSRFVGPAALMQGARFVLDSRDHGFSARLDRLNGSDGVWSCRNHFECTRVCPRNIKITKNINLTKQEITRRREAPPRGQA